jgi:5S rRNA maturation endonuclease (ribonuclease M5)
MTKLYLDCDGVILDTINMSYKMIKNKGLTNEKDIEHFYKNLSWEELIIEAGEINNSIEKIKELTKVYDVEILTHVNSDGEIIAKLNYFKEVLPEVKVMAVPKEIRKADAVDPKGNILVDDFLGNLDYWHEKGGISIKFSDSGKKCIYQTITDLSELLKLKS